MIHDRTRKKIDTRWTYFKLSVPGFVGQIMGNSRISSLKTLLGMSGCSWTTTRVALPTNAIPTIYRVGTLQEPSLKRILGIVGYS